MQLGTYAHEHNADQLKKITIVIRSSEHSQTDWLPLITFFVRF